MFIDLMKFGFGQTNERTDEPMNQQTDGWIGGQANGSSGGQQMD